MRVIRKLLPDVAGKIAAGEVVERPVSVIKELVENALDASAHRISIALSDGGRVSMSVEDDGTGIPSEELPLALENFSTSKISSAADINTVATLGFRGEALASIRAVSHMTIRSRTDNEDVGREMQWRGNDLLSDAPCAKNRGTEIFVSSLFFNLPARRKFLSSGPSEMRRIQSLIQSYALAFPATGFTLKSGDTQVLNLPPSSLPERVEGVFGSAIMENLEALERRSTHITIHGFISLPNMTRGNRSLQFIFVNNRIVKDRLLSHAVLQAYQSLIPQNRYPLFVLFVDLPPEDIDVNIHPAKAEIRFKNEREVHRLVSTTLREALRESSSSFKDRVDTVYRKIFPGPAEGMTGAYGRRDEGERRGGFESAAVDKPSWLFHEAPLSLFQSEGGGELTSAGKLYWQLHRSFILIQIRGGLVIVDQHAAHERILFNEAKANVNGGNPTVQSLLFPATLDLSPDEFETYETISGVLPSLGFDVAPFGTRSIIVRGIPAGVRNWEDGDLLQEILSEKTRGRTGIEEFLKLYACRCAVKAGTTLSVEEMESLTDQLFATEFPFTCPHGRPTMLRVETAELERRFQRTVSSKE